MILQGVFSGILLGGLYTCIGVGFSLVWGVSNILNMAHGSFIVLGAYLTYTLYQALGISPFLTIPPVMLALFLMGFSVQRWLLPRVMKSLLMVLTFTFGLDLLLQNAMVAIWSPDPRIIQLSWSAAGFTVGGGTVTYLRLAALLAAVGLTGVLDLILARTKVGQAIRATALDPGAAEMIGVSVPTVHAVTFGLGAAWAGAAGALLSMIVAFQPFSASELALKAFIVTIVGGLGSISGAVLAGLLLGLVEVLGVQALGATWQSAISFALMILLLILRPQGLLGKRFFGEAHG
ncbi:MAG TPA: branched-chain amino acid ABC transporter permease [Symbiobacteriaceae bacterium]|nr:branched-chain amino acid ABC transporter permease [Symbiobacteriaceae bacterium]